jgi:hypothetical protein
MKTPKWLREVVQRRALGACEYCRLPQYASILEGRASVELLGMNDEERIRLRFSLTRNGWCP